ncbi:MAG: hypothetical protein LBO69_01310 [Ignavibacteria bacterium]|nr:hypothetical protein [Ignavibacteria bacterium]
MPYAGDGSRCDNRASRLNNEIRQEANAKHYSGEFGESEYGSGRSKGTNNNHPSNSEWRGTFWNLPAVL